jgi:hypothetical protein
MRPGDHRKDVRIYHSTFSAQVEISNKVNDVLRALCIDDWQSTPHEQHPNPAESMYQTVKTMTNTLLDFTGSPAYTWLLCLMYVCLLLNFTVSAVLKPQRTLHSRPTRSKDQRSERRVRSSFVVDPVARQQVLRYHLRLPLLPITLASNT